MFDQTFVGEARQSGKPYSVFASVLAQSVVVGLAVLIPLLVTQTLPNASLKGILVAPAPPAAPKPVVAMKSRATVNTRSFQAARLATPTVVPRQIATVNEVQVAPDVSGVDMGTALSAPEENAVRQAPAPAPPPAAKQASRGLMRVGGQVAEANIIRRVDPIYPALARTARVQGTVEFTAVISKEGRVEKLQLVRGHPLLVTAAREAILQWRYRPTMLNGQAVEVVTSITVNFTLAQ